MPETQQSIECWLMTETHTLLLHVPPRGELSGFWQPITGGIESEEGAAAAASREIREETGLRICPFRSTQITSDVHVKISDELVINKTLFHVSIEQFAVQLRPSEHDDSRYVLHDEVASWLFWPSNVHTWELAWAHALKIAPELTDSLWPNP